MVWFEQDWFEPSGSRAERLDRTMRERLAQSLEYVAAQSAGIIPVPEALKGFLARLRAAPVPPAVFAAYCDLVVAIDDDELDAARRLFGEIAASGNHAGGLRVLEFADPARDPASARYLRHFDTDPDTTFAILPPPAALAQKCRDRIDQALALMQSGDPELAAEIRGLLREIVLAVGPQDPKAMTFDGASAFFLWGAILLNAQGQSTVLEMVQALAHESGHNLLFGLCAHGPLVENDDSERFASPLRRDPRPLDGIIHATYVTARMHRAVQRLLEAGVLRGNQVGEAEGALLAHVRGFKSGLDVVERHGVLTERGRAAMDAARRHML